VTAGRPLRVLVVDHTGELGGAELALVRLVETIAPDVRVRCLLFSDGPLAAALRARGVGVEVLDLGRGLSTLSRHEAGTASWAHLARTARLVRFSARLLRRLRDLRPDVVHTTSLKADLLTLLPAALTGCPVVWHVHDRISDDYLPSSLVRLVRWASRLPRAVVVNSRATAETIPRAVRLAYPGFAPGQAIPPGQPVPRRPGPPVIGIVGRISPTKGQLELVRAASLVLRSHPEATFRVVGGPTFGEEAYERTVRAEADRLGVTSSIAWVGKVEDPADELDRMTVFVHASPVPEPFGQVVVEAMIRGVPVVATEAGGVPEILRPDGAELGSLVPPGDVAGLAMAITELLDDPERAASRAERAREHAFQRFPVERTAEVVTDVWRRAARSGGRPRP
jgi:glycosyltransferase involved in cell wall biosynthesis